ncbi:acyl-CoA dehydrogenase [Sphingomonas sp. S1-29]|uniref:acyl-CoA dehydrogenase n=1 Tax=Sphingomonas sp. S1-29 TaxID=2991074 RepID=UPI00224038E0|nr:acyl-CoA dehydrogenase [Sphingomonas sp. S1-29]UZK70477.1 acyl-CoA dehydrogenase [Sphingomonas sp. S1-29]
MTDPTSLGAVLARYEADSIHQLPAALAALHRLLPVRGDPATPEDLLALLRMLHAIARRDLPLARLFEGHVDALQIIARYDPAIVQGAEAAAARSGIFGVWNAALPGEPLHIVDGTLHGGKSFASGAGVLTHALAGADTVDGNRLVLIDLAASRPAIDRSRWHVVGMQRSESHVVRWDGAPPASFGFVGDPGDYAREPFFSGGALRFVACHAGGVAALFDHVRDHLLTTERAEDPHQAGRLAELYTAAESAAAAIRTAAAAWGQPGFVDHVAAARMIVTACAERAILTAQTAAGVGGMFITHPLSAALTDLMVYLRQPMPDAQRMRVGKAAAGGLLDPGL